MSEEMDRLKADLNDPDSEWVAWTCPQCRRSHHKAYGLKCDRCNFDANELLNKP